MKVLFFGSHCDDIELGCGGTINKHNKDWDISCVCMSSSGSYGEKSFLKNQSLMALSSLGVKNIYFENYPTNDFWIHRQDIWKSIKKYEEIIDPQIVFTQMEDDHQDHKILFQETIRNFKDKTIMCYKASMSYGLSHVWNYIEKLKYEDILKKIEAANLFSYYQDIGKSYVKPENIIAQARVMSMNTNFEFSEAFYVYRIVSL